MIIRAASAADAGSVAALWNDMIRTSLATFTTKEKTVAEIEGLIAQRDNAFWVAEDVGVQGFVTFGAFRSGPGYAATVEHTIILAPGAQGRGTGRALMSHAMTAAAAQGLHVMVAAISSANRHAVAFHSALGFVQSGVMPEVGRKNGLWLDLILMQKTLPAR